MKYSESCVGVNVCYVQRVSLVEVCVLVCVGACV